MKHEPDCPFIGGCDTCGPVDESPTESVRVQRSPTMTECKHHEECPECSAMRITANRKNELRKEIAELLGVAHLKGTRQLEAALKRIDELLDMTDDIGTRR